MKHFNTGLLLLSVATSFASSVSASGHLPPVEMPPQSFASFDACVEHLRQLYAHDLVGAKQGPQQIEGGATREAVVDTKGVVTNERDEAHYDAELGWSIRKPGGDAVGNRWMQTNYNFERWSRTCRGASLTGTMESGFTSPSVEPLR
ncbi:hypothetical protein ACMAVI_002634 [Burkholderia cenocepacia]|uniref:hypothetical protein n=1 Tax=Burkholderia cenocepacia TaxID=95486 RepID=UPI00084149E7|nr:hypothetical protein [Burkholderia cenocepacia]AOJ18338.1 hypothetical protein WJ11_02680 [Burkholderia cenocepacia]